MSKYIKIVETFKMPPSFRKKVLEAYAGLTDADHTLCICTLTVGDKNGNREPLDTLEFGTHATLMMAVFRDSDAVAIHNAMQDFLGGDSENE